MLNSNETNSPLSMPFECVSSAAFLSSLPVKSDGYYDTKIVFSRKGRLQVHLGEEQCTLATGEMLLICPQVSFEMSRVPEDEDGEFLMLRVDVNQMGLPVYTPGVKSVLLAAMRQKMPMRFDAAMVEQEGLLPLGEACVRESENRGFGWETAIMSRVHQILIAVTRRWLQQGLKLPGKAVEEDPIYSITSYIHRHVQDGLRVEELASRCNLSYPWFAKKFREIYGVSCKEYIERLRISRVDQYLLYTDWDLSEISRITGYADCSHMIKNFKRLKNITPGQYRMAKKDNG